MQMTMALEAKLERLTREGKGFQAQAEGQVRRSLLHIACLCILRGDNNLDPFLQRRKRGSTLRAGNCRQLFERSTDA